MTEYQIGIGFFDISLPLKDEQQHLDSAVWYFVAEGYESLTKAILNESKKHIKEKYPDKEVDFDYEVLETREVDPITWEPINES
jgi:hypothetical protein